MPVIAGLAVSAGIGGYQMIKGMSDSKKLQDQMNANVMPKYNIPQEEFDSQRLAQSMASQGMSSASREAYNQEAQAGLGGSIEALERTGAAPGTLNTAYAGYNTGQRNLAIYDDQARLSHLGELYNRNDRISAERDKQWQLNQYAPWANRAQSLAQQIAGAKTMENAGLNTLASAGTGLIGGLGKVKSVFGNQAQPAAQITTNTPVFMEGSFVGPPEAPTYQYQNGQYSPNLPPDPTGDGDFQLPWFAQ